MLKQGGRGALVLLIGNLFVEVLAPEGRFDPPRAPANPLERLPGWLQRRIWGGGGRAHKRALPMGATCSR